MYGSKGIACRNAGVPDGTQAGQSKHCWHEMPSVLTEHRYLEDDTLKIMPAGLKEQPKW